MFLGDDLSCPTCCLETLAHVELCITKLLVQGYSKGHHVIEGTPDEHVSLGFRLPNSELGNHAARPTDELVSPATAFLMSEQRFLHMTTGQRCIEIETYSSSCSSSCKAAAANG